VLTTHYLEEAQAMCQRVAMLRAGKVVALDTMSALIRRISGSQLIVHLASGELPADLRHLISHDESQNGKKVSLRVSEYGEVEQILARLRESGCTIDEMQLQQADLEDIFLQIMDGGSL
jgi:ABC-2 type transport system ATP-binding protein